LLVFSNQVFDAANKVRVGSDQGYCVRITAGKSWECFWTLILKTGQITVEGPFMDEGDSLFAVTGGTGEYAGAKGSLTLHPRDAPARSSAPMRIRQQSGRRSLRTILSMPVRG
jgi:allene oxide cyclase